MKYWKRLRDILIEVLIASSLVGGMVAYVSYHPNTGLPWPWIALVGNTAIVFGSLIAWFRYAWKTPVFWLCLMVLLLGHSAAYILVLSRIHDFPLVWYVLLNSGELVVLAPIVEKSARNYSD